ncbi:hypothetical protein ACFOPQ_05315 [Deinococcus antarcticus]|uniref:Nucleoside 2-deoxyribosyltransferase n=1 Tax=Deinococcus antarcticus TaxID=1298767 RepID=A0ABV8A6X7_9DEIO
MSQPPIMYFVATGSRLAGQHPQLGVITSPRSSISAGVREGRPWIADCDIFSKDGYSQDAYFTHLERMAPWRKACRFIVVPDCPGDGEGTLHGYYAMAEMLAPLGYPLAYVFQDGAEKLPLPPCDYTFIGGTNDWRMRHAAGLIQRAHDAGLGCHVGRVNSGKRLAMLAQAGADSADGTYLSYVGVEQGLADVTRWLQEANQPRLLQRS